MHYHLEIVMPPVGDIKEAISQILAPFNMDRGEDDEDASVAFWDWWVVGGRYAGSKQECAIDTEKLAEFRQWLTEEKVMVKGFVAGKEELADESTREKVDAKWVEMFPNQGPHCILFKHANNQYDGASLLPGDVCKVSELPAGLKANRVIVAGPHWNDAAKLESKTMFQQEFWNGVNHIKAEWDGSLNVVLADSRVGELVQPDWLVVTVDYHS